MKLNTWKKIGLAAVVILIVAVSIPSLYNFKKESSDGRLLVWKVSGSIIKEHPFIGIGYGRFHSEYNLSQADYFKGSHDKGRRTDWQEMLQLAFSDYVESLVETGIIGFILFISLICFALGSFKLKQDQVNLFLFPFVIFLVLSLVSYPGNTLTTKILFFFFVASFSRFTVNIERSTTMNGLHRRLVVILLIVSLPFAVVQVTKYNKYKTFLYASQAYSAGNYDVSEAHFRQGY